MNVDFKNIKNSFNPTILSKKFLGFLNKKSQWIIVSGFVFVLAYCGYLWYRYIRNPQWSESRQQEYIKSKQKEASFNKKGFDDAIRGIEEKKNEYQRKIDNIPDIFRIK